MHRWSEQDEAAFVKRLENELLKCEKFQVGKVSPREASFRPFIRGVRSGISS